MKFYLLTMLFLLVGCEKSSSKSCFQPLLLTSQTYSGDYKLSTYESSLSDVCLGMIGERDFWVHIQEVDSPAIRLFIESSELSLEALNRFRTYHNRAYLRLVWVQPISDASLELLWATFEGSD